MTFRNHQEFDVTVVAVAAVGARVEVQGATGFVDRVKHPSWRNENIALPQVGDRLHVVVLDTSREPPRLSALRQDIDIARRLRGRGSEVDEGYAVRRVQAYINRQGSGASLRRT
jgi:hypothetical protein